MQQSANPLGLTDIKPASRSHLRLAALTQTRRASRDVFFKFGNHLLATRMRHQASIALRYSISSLDRPVSR